MQRRTFAQASLVALAAPALAFAEALEKPKLTLAVGGKNLLYYLPLTIAESLGYFKSEGLDVTIVDFAGGSQALRAVVFVREGTPKGTARSAQEYVDPLLVLSGCEYAGSTFGQLHDMMCNALRGHRPRLVAESWGPDGRGRLVFEDGRAGH